MNTDQFIPPEFLMTGDAEVGTIMSTQLTTVAPDQPVSEVAEIFTRVIFHHLPVVAEDVLVGILSDRDLSKCLVDEQGNQTQRAADIMSPHPTTVDPSTTIETASILLLENRFSCLPVIGEHNRLVGILSWKDLLRFYVYHASSHRP